MPEDNGQKDPETIAKMEEYYKGVLGPYYEDGGRVDVKACPHCGGEDKLFEDMYQYLIFKGKMPPGFMACSSTSVQFFTDPRGPGLIGSKSIAIVVYRDICRGCGMEHPVRIERKDMAVSAAQMPGQLPVDKKEKA